MKVVIIFLLSCCSKNMDLLLQFNIKADIRQSQSLFTFNAWQKCIFNNDWGCQSLTLCLTSAFVWLFVRKNDPFHKNQFAIMRRRHDLPEYSACFLIGWRSCQSADWLITPHARAHRCSLLRVQLGGPQGWMKGWQGTWCPSPLRSGADAVHSRNDPRAFWEGRAGEG